MKPGCVFKNQHCDPRKNQLLVHVKFFAECAEPVLGARKLCHQKP